MSRALVSLGGTGCGGRAEPSPPAGVETEAAAPGDTEGSKLGPLARGCRPPVPLAVALAGDRGLTGGWACLPGFRPAPCLLVRRHRQGQVVMLTRGVTVTAAGWAPPRLPAWLKAPAQNTCLCEQVLGAGHSAALHPPPAPGTLGELSRC